MKRTADVTKIPEIEMKINAEVINTLSEQYKEKRISQKLLFECMKAFIDLYTASFCSKAREFVYTPEAVGASEYQNMLETAKRGYRNAELTSVGMLTALNRMAERNGLDPVYEGDISNSPEDIAAIRSAVLEYVADFIQ